MLLDAGSLTCVFLCWQQQIPWKRRQLLGSTRCFFQLCGTVAQGPPRQRRLTNTKETGGAAWPFYTRAVAASRKLIKHRCCFWKQRPLPSPVSQHSTAQAKTRSCPPPTPEAWPGLKRWTDALAKLNPPKHNEKHQLKKPTLRCVSKCGSLNRTPPAQSQWNWIARRLDLVVTDLTSDMFVHLRVNEVHQSGQFTVSWTPRWCNKRAV